MPLYVIAFESTHAAIAADDALRDVPRAMIPTPRQITASCGMALRVEVEDDRMARDLVAKADVPASMARLYREVPSENGSARNAEYVAL